MNGNVLIRAKCMGMTTIEVRTIEVRTKNYDIRDDLGDCTKTEIG